MILCIGEILIDMEKNDNVIEKHVGGAPFNVSINAKDNGSIVGFIGCVGNDENGNIIKNYINLSKLDYKILQVVNKPSTVASITIDSNGERDFKFIRDDTSDYQLDITKIDFNVYKDLNIVHIGTLMLSEEKGRLFIIEIINKIKETSAKISVDVNFRYDIYKNEMDMINAYDYILEKADIIKFSEEELDIYNKHRDLNKLYINKIIIITRGKNGSEIIFDNRNIKSKSIMIKPIDSTGAGDAFYGTLLSLIEKNNIYELNDSCIEDMLFNANKVGALTTQFYGAIKKLNEI